MNKYVSEEDPSRIVMFFKDERGEPLAGTVYTLYDVDRDGLRWVKGRGKNLE